MTTGRINQITANTSRGQPCRLATRVKAVLGLHIAPLPREREGLSGFAMQTHLQKRPRSGRTLPNAVQHLLPRANSQDHRASKSLRPVRRVALDHLISRSEYWTPWSITAGRSLGCLYQRCFGLKLQLSRILLGPGSTQS